MDAEGVCCGQLFYAELVKNIVVLECCRCGRRWRAESQRGLVPFGDEDSEGVPNWHGDESVPSLSG
jgi:hypothetical protein